MSEIFETGSHCRYFKNVVKDKDNYIHLFYAPFHFKMNLYHLIPDEILKINQRDRDLLVIGYCKQSEKNDKLQFIPNYLKQLIVKLYPMFL